MDTAARAASEQGWRNAQRRAQLGAYPASAARAGERQYLNARLGEVRATASRMSDTALPAIAAVNLAEELESPARRALRRLFRRKGAVTGLAVVTTFILLAIFAPLVSPYDPVATSWTLVRKPPDR